MAINFPPPPGDKGDLIDGDYYTDSETGKQWQYDASIDAWRSVGGNLGPGIVYRGPIDLNVDPNTQYANIVSGNLFAVASGTANIDSNLYPGLSGQILAPAEIIYGGNPGVWSILSGNVPYATETTAGRIQIATQNEVTAGTDATKAVVPAYLKTVIDSIDVPDELPSGADGKWLGHGVNDPEWKDLPTSQTGRAGITRYATTAEVTAVIEFDGNYVTDAAVTPDSLKLQFDSIFTAINLNDARLDVVEPKVDDNTSNITTNTTNISTLDTTLTNHIGSGGDAHALVTDTTAGFMSADDKVKLDGLSSSTILPTPENENTWGVGSIGVFVIQQNTDQAQRPGPWKAGQQRTMGTGNQDTFLVSCSMRGNASSTSNSLKINTGTWMALSYNDLTRTGDGNVVVTGTAGLWTRIS